MCAYFHLENHQPVIWGISNVCMLLMFLILAQILNFFTCSLSLSVSCTESLDRSESGCSECYAWWPSCCCFQCGVSRFLQSESAVKCERTWARSLGQRHGAGCRGQGPGLQLSLIQNKYREQDRLMKFRHAPLGTISGSDSSPSLSQFILSHWTSFSSFSFISFIGPISPHPTLLLFLNGPLLWNSSFSKHYLLNSSPCLLFPVVFFVLDYAVILDIMKFVGPLRCCGYVWLVSTLRLFQ